MHEVYEDGILYKMHIWMQKGGQRMWGTPAHVLPADSRLQCLLDAAHYSPDLGMLVTQGSCDESPMCHHLLRYSNGSWGGYKPHDGAVELHVTCRYDRSCMTDGAATPCSCQWFVHVTRCVKLLLARAQQAACHNLNINYSPIHHGARSTAVQSVRSVVVPACTACQSRISHGTARTAATSAMNECLSASPAAGRTPESTSRFTAKSHNPRGTCCLCAHEVHASFCSQGTPGKIIFRSYLLHAAR